MEALTLEKGLKIIEGAFAKSAEMKLKPLVIALFDARGCLKAFQSQDGQEALIRSDIAQAKAYGALAMGIGSRTIAKRAKDGPAFIATALELAGGRLMPVAGGVLIRDAEGRIAGALGVSGDTSDNDELCAIAGIEGAGFKADPGSST